MGFEWSMLPGVNQAASYQLKEEENEMGSARCFLLPSQPAQNAANPPG
jgi:hypothetical protein